MKLTRIGLMLAASAFLTSCAYVPPKEGSENRVSPDYVASGINESTRAFVYAGRTVLEFDGYVAFLTVKDETGATVDYEKIGRHYRLAERLNRFTVWVNGHAITFSAAKNIRVFSAAAVEPAPIAEAVKIAAVEAEPNPQEKKTIEELLALSVKQLEGIRTLIKAANKNPQVTGFELFELEERQREIERRLHTMSAAIVSVTFPTASTTFKPTPAVKTVLIASAKIAESINLQGQTDSRIAGSQDARIALGRAKAAQKFFVDNGVSAEKINVTSQAEGGFIAPNGTKEGRALNRRVEIEFLNNHIAETKSLAVKLAVLENNRKGN